MSSSTEDQTSPFRSKGCVALLGVLAFSGVQALTPDARAQDECVSDDDCPSGFGCDLPPQIGGDAEPRPGTCEPTDTSEQPCSSDDDCPDNYTCEFGDVLVAATPGCAVSSDGTEQCPELDPTPIDQGESEGICEPGLVDCDTNADCPEPASCGDEGFCVWEPTLCGSDDVCDPNYSCQVLGESGSCSSEPVPGSTSPIPTAGAPVQGDPVAGGPVEAAATQDAPITVFKQSAEVCQTEAISACFPDVVECETDDDCEGDWVCFVVPSEDGGPEEWAGIDKACMAPGIALAVEGQIPLVGELAGGSSSDSALGESAGPLSTQSAVAADGVSGNGPAGNGLAGNANEAIAVNADETAAEPESGGCQLGTAPSGAPAALWVLFGTLALLPIRRRQNTTSPA